MVGRTCISLTQNVTNVQCCEAVFVLVGGQVRTELIVLICLTLCCQVVETGTHQELWEKRGEYWSMWRSGNMAKWQN